MDIMEQRLRDGPGGRPRVVAHRKLGEIKDEIRQANLQAMRWLSMWTVSGLSVVAVAVEDGGSPHHDWLWRAGWCCYLAAQLLLAAALLPRMRGSTDNADIAYFGHIYRLRHPDLIRSRLRAAEADVEPGMAEQLFWTSRIVVIKYWLTGAGITGAVLAMALIVISVVVL